METASLKALILDGSAAAPLDLSPSIFAIGNNDQVYASATWYASQ